MKLQDVKDMDRNDVLALLGLETKQSEAGRMVMALGTFGVGLLVGSGVALLLAPKPGRELRQDIRDRIRPGKAETDGVGGVVPDAPNRGA